jgi:ABC-2 type transport system permease protein
MVSPQLSQGNRSFGFRASNANYPISIIPTWLQVISRINPLTYEGDALRALMLADGASVYGVRLDFLVLILATTVLIYIASKAYPNVVV